MLRLRGVAGFAASLGNGWFGWAALVWAAFGFGAVAGCGGGGVVVLRVAGGFEVEGFGGMRPAGGHGVVMGSATPENPMPSRRAAALAVVPRPGPWSGAPRQRFIPHAWRLKATTHPTCNGARQWHCSRAGLVSQGPGSTGRCGKPPLGPPPPRAPTVAMSCTPRCAMVRAAEHSASVPISSMTTTFDRSRAGVEAPGFRLARG